MEAKFYIFLFAMLSLLNLNGQSNITIEHFDNSSIFYTAFNSGNGSVTTSNQVSNDNSFMKVNYQFFTGNGSAFTTFRNYGDVQQDFSFQTASFSIQHKGGNNSNELSIRLWEDINGNGLFDDSDEVYESPTITTGNSDWTITSHNISSFVKIVGNGNSEIDLNRIRAWDIKISNTTDISNSGTLYLDNFELTTQYTSPAIGTNQINGSFIQLWNTAGCKCGTWSQEKWDQELQKMKDINMSSLIIQYSVYHNHSWYSPTNVTGVIYQEPTLNKIIQAAEKVDIKVQFGLYFDEAWISSNKSSQYTYSSILQKHKTVIDDLWNLFGNSPSFGGWYIPQELNDLEWQSINEQTLLFNWIKDVTDYAKTKSIEQPTMIAPFFNLWQPADKIEEWYNSLFSIANNLDRVYPQDGVGITLKNPSYHIPLYYNAIRNACVNHGVDFGSTIETFQQINGWPINSNPFEATSADIDRIKTQLWTIDELSPTEIIQFSWSYMQPGLSMSSSHLYETYSTYINEVITSEQTLNTSSSYIYPNPTNDKLNISTSNKDFKIAIFDSNGSLIFEGINSKNLDVSQYEKGLYILELKSNETIEHLKFKKL